MLNLQWTWREAAVTTAVFFTAWRAATGTRWARTAGPFLREAALVCGLYALWQVAAATHPNGADRKSATSVWHHIR